MTEPILLAEDIVDHRDMAEAMLTDVCTITIPDPDADAPEFDETTGQYSATPGVIVYGPGAEDDAYSDGRCRFQIKADINSNIVETTAGEREWTYFTSQLQLPVSSLYVPTDAIVHCVSAAYNPALPGRIFNVHGEIAPKSVPVIRRFRLREVSA